MTIRTKDPFDDWPLTRLLDAVDPGDSQDAEITVSDVLEEIGSRTITPIILIVSMLLVSPLSAVPGMPSAAAVLIILLAAQAIVGRRRVWLPRAIMRFRIRARHLNRAVTWLRRPAHWVDRHARPRLTALTSGPARVALLTLCIAVPLFWPLLEPLPGITSVLAATIALFAFGLFARDGIYVLMGLGLLATVVGAGSALIVTA